MLEATSVKKKKTRMSMRGWGRKFQRSINNLEIKKLQNQIVSIMTVILYDETDGQII